MGLISRVSSRTYRSCPKMNTLSSSSKLFIRIGAISGALSVILGAIGSHKLKKDYQNLDTEKAQHLTLMFEKANKYHMINSVMTIVSAVVPKYPKISCSLFILSIFLFSGPLYIQCFTKEYSKINKIAPYGGFCTIFGWLSLIF